MRAGCGDSKNPEASSDASGFFVSEHSSSGPPADVVAEFPSLRQREAAIRKTPENPEILRGFVCWSSAGIRQRAAGVFTTRYR